MSAKTSINQDINRRVNGYMINAVPGIKNSQRIAMLQSKLAAQFGDSLWLTPPATLHITLMDWIAPLVEYEVDNETLFKDVLPGYDEAFIKILQAQPPVTIHFDTLKVTPGAIILIGHDDGSFKRIRDNFLQEVALMPNTKKPPTIIHSTIARYKTERDLQPLIDFVATQGLVFDCEIERFRLVQERITPMLEYNILKEYHLGGIK